MDFLNEIDSMHKLVAHQPTELVVTHSKSMPHRLGEHQTDNLYIIIGHSEADNKFYDGDVYCAAQPVRGEKWVFSALPEELKTSFCLGRKSPQ